MERRFTIGLCIVLIAFSGDPIYSQDFTNPERREINLKIYSSLGQYTRYGKLSSNYSSIDESYIEAFKALFDSSATVFNDILPMNRMDTVMKLEQYIDATRHYYPSGIGFRFQNIQLGIPFMDTAGNCSLDVVVTKEIYGTTGQNANYKDTVELTIRTGFKMSESQPTDIKITGITGKPKGRTLKFLFINKRKGTPFNKLVLTFDGQNQKPDNRGRITIKNINANTTHRYKMEKEELPLISLDNFKVDTLLNNIPLRTDREYFDPNEIIIELRPARFYLTFFLAPAITGKNVRFFGYDTYRIDSTRWTNDSYTRSQDFYLGIKAGFKMFNIRNMDVLFFSGIELNRFTGTLNAESYQSKFNGFDGSESYTREVALSGLSQTIGVRGFTIPVHLLLRIKKMVNLNLNIETGVNLNFFKNHIFTGSADAGIYQGLYEQYLDLIIDDEPNLGFGSTKPESPEQASWDGSSDAISIYFSPSISKKITKSAEIYAGPVLNYGIKNISNTIIRRPLTNEMDEFNPVTDVSEKVKFGAISLEIGFRYRFADFSSYRNFPH